MSPRTWSLRCFLCGDTSTVQQQPPSTGLNCVKPLCKGTRFRDLDEPQPEDRQGLQTWNLPNHTADAQALAATKAKERANGGALQITTEDVREVLATAPLPAPRGLREMAAEVLEEAEQEIRTATELRQAALQAQARAEERIEAYQELQGTFRHALEVYDKTVGAISPSPQPAAVEAPPVAVAAPEADACPECKRAFGSPNAQGRPLKKGIGGLCTGCYQKRFSR